MITVYIHIVGVVTFALVAYILGNLLRRNKSKQKAEELSKIMHFFFHFGLTFPPAVSIFYPGLKQFDSLLGLTSINSMYTLSAGIVLLLIALYFLVGSIRGLGSQGNGAPAFKLTESVAKKGVYRSVRNPMSLGHYLLYLGGSLVVGSTYLTLGTILFIIPAHIFHLKYFEELELELRYGDEYLQYKKELPFLIPRFRQVSRLS